jgi:hypothetical protein
MEALPVAGEEARRLDSPVGLKIDLVPNLAGVIVRLSHGPSRGDPLDQRGTIRHFETLGEAIGKLPDLVTAHLDAHHDAAEELRLKGRHG